MKITTTLAIASSLFLAVGCASRQERTARYQENTYSSSSPSYQAWGNSSENNITASRQNDYTGRYSGSASAAGASGSTSPSDSIVVTEIRQSLAGNSEVAPIISEITITEDNGTVTLSGTVPNEQQKQRIESLVQQTTGVTQVNNQLNVSSQSSSNQGTSRSEGLSSTGSPNGPAGAVSGTGSESQASENKSAGDAASDQSMSPTSRTNSNSQIYQQENKQGDNSSSTNQNQSSTSDQSSLSATGQSTGTTPRGTIVLNIKGTSPGDQIIVQQVTQDLQADTTLAPVLSQIRIIITDGKATLSGNVRDEQQKQQVESTVKKSSGVTSVDNQLKTGGSLNPTSGSTNSPERIYHEPGETPK